MKLTRKKQGIAFASLFAVAATAAALSGGIGIGEAKHHWAPHDPANYWSQTSISWADTNDPGHYFYHDLGKQGGNVIDITRVIKSVLFGDDFRNILSTVLADLGIEITNHQSLDAQVKRQNGEVIGRNGERIPVLYETIRESSFEGSPYFHTFRESQAAADTPRNLVMQRSIISSAAEGYANVAQLSIAGNDETRAAVRRLVEAAANAQGEQELREIIAQLKALQASGEGNLSAVQAAQTQMERDKQAAVLDEEIEHEKEYERMELNFVDPYSEELKKSYDYTREPARGLVPFE